MLHRDVKEGAFLCILLPYSNDFLFSLLSSFFSYSVLLRYFFYCFNPYLLLGD